MKRREHGVERPGAAHVTCKMEEDIRLRVANDLDQPLRIAHVPGPPLDIGARALGPGDGIDSRALLQQPVEEA